MNGLEEGSIDEDKDGWWYFSITKEDKNITASSVVMDMTVNLWRIRPFNAYFARER